MPWLVSYAFGDLAQCYFERHGIKEDVLACFNQRIDGSDNRCRPDEECCPKGGPPSNLTRIQSESGWCAKVVCTDIGTACPPAAEE